MNTLEGTGSTSILQSFEILLSLGWIPPIEDPAYEKISGQYAELLHAVKVDIDEEPALADAERIEVVPTLVLYANGKALGSIVAPGSKAAIDAFIREYLEV